MGRTLTAGGLHPEITLPHTQEWELHLEGESTGDGYGSIRIDSVGTARLGDPRSL